MNYKQLYINLATELTNLGCRVCDDDFLGLCIYPNKNRAFIYITPNMSYKHKYFTLAHEAGHIFFMKKDKIFNWSKKERPENKANMFAIKILGMNKIKSEEYKIFYSGAIKRGRPNKSWFELKEE